jgi:hypothetical protein
MDLLPGCCVADHGLLPTPVIQEPKSILGDKFSCGVVLFCVVVAAESWRRCNSFENETPW